MYLGGSIIPFFVEIEFSQKETKRIIERDTEKITITF